ncbi:MAG: right-handed parallel beta-helix repeat-containing protein [Acidobacteriia bacterium]|nr:right-handed parallel beta-helix repeat-containing protein [Terriglobia bacterium]
MTPCWSVPSGSAPTSPSLLTGGTQRLTATVKKSAAATATVSAPAVVSVSIAPTSVSLLTGDTQQFTATVSGANNTALTWQVNGAPGGNVVVGTVSNSGLYTSPSTVPSPATVTLTAVSQADATKSASAQLTIVASSGTGRSLYVSTSGSDSNPGTLAAPWKTIQHAANSVQAGETVYVLGGFYNEIVRIASSGSATAGPITLQSYPGQTAIVDGTGLAPPSTTQGLFNVAGQSYVTIQGFEIRNYQTGSASATPAAIWVSGSGSNIQLLNNSIHDIVTTSEKNGNAFGIAVYGTAAPASLDRITIGGNEVYNLKTGGGESVSVDGNVTNFAITNNIIHDNDNIGIGAIGFEGVAPNPAYDYPRYGVIGGNTVYNISAIHNAGEGNVYNADGIYCDGCSQVIIEGNRVYAADLGIEVASEHSGRVAGSVTVRNNLVYHTNSAGISIGGYASKTGGTDHCTIVNNTLFQNDTKSTGSGEFQVQYYATNNVFENNIVYATSQGLFINNYTNSGPNPVAANHNLYFSSLSWSAAEFIWNGSSRTGFTSYQSASGQDIASWYADPLLLSLTTPDLHPQAASPAVNRGAELGAAVEGTIDFAGQPRVQGSRIDIGAYQR